MSPHFSYTRHTQASVKSQTRHPGARSLRGGRLLPRDRKAAPGGRARGGAARGRCGPGGGGGGSGSEARPPGRPARGVPAARPCARPSPPAAPPRLLAMVERGDAAPLLRWAEGPAVSPPLAPDPQAGGRGWGGGGGGGRLAAEPPRRREPEELGPSEVLLQPGRLVLGDVEEDQVVAVFVVTFDPRSGESFSGTGGGAGRGSPPTPGLGVEGEGLAARAPSHLHPSPPAGLPRASGVPPRGRGARLCSCAPDSTP